MSSRTEAAEEALQAMHLRGTKNRSLILSALETGDDSSPRFKDLRIKGELNHDGSSIGFFNQAPTSQPSSTGEVTGFTQGTGSTVSDESTFTGNVGATAYRINDVVKHLKNLGLIAK